MRATFVQTMRATLLEQVNTRFFSPTPHNVPPVRVNILRNALYTVPTLLNPAFRRGLFFGEDETGAKEALVEGMRKLDIQLGAEQDRDAQDLSVSQPLSQLQQGLNLTLIQSLTLVGFPLQHTRLYYLQLRYQHRNYLHKLYIIS